MHALRLIHFAPLIVLAITLQACTTVETWDRGLPRQSDELTTDAAKRAEFQHFVIHDVGLAHGKGCFYLSGEADQDKHCYSAASFYPVIEEVSPEVKDAVDELSGMREKHSWAGAATGTGAAAWIFGPTAVIRNLGAGALILGTGGAMVIDAMEKEQLETVMERYNSDLTRRIYVRKKLMPSAWIPRRSAGQSREAVC